MLRSIRALSTMSRDPAFPILLEECASLAGRSNKKQYISVALNLLEEDHTVPFIARYRREQTGDIPVNDLYELQRKWADFTATIKLRTSRLAALETSGRCTEEVKRAFFECTTKEELDELYATYKEVKTAKSELINAFSVGAVAEDMMQGKQKFYVVTQESADIAKSSKYSVFDAISYHCAATMASDLSIKDHAKDQFSRHPTIVTTTLTTAYKNLQKGSLSSDKDKSKAGVASKPVKSGTGESVPKMSELHKYKDYHSVNRRITQLAAHQLLAIRRGKEAGVLAISLSPDEAAKDHLFRYINRKYNVYYNAAAPAKDQPSVERVGYRIGRDDVLCTASKEAVSKLCASLTKKQWKDAITAAEIEAAEVFSISLRPLLLTAPLRTVIGGESSAGFAAAASNATTVVCAVDPGFAHGHKWVVLAQAGSKLNVAEGMQAQGNETSILCYGKIFESSAKHSSSSNHNHSSNASPRMLASPAQFAEVLVRYKVTAVAIGNGTGSREAQAFVSAALEHASSDPQSTKSSSSESDNTLKRKHADLEHSHSSSASNASNSTGCVGYAVVSEAGASVYSASERAREEFPSNMLDIAYVGAVSIGRRLVDPLSELIKVQPASLGVGMYQHDLSDKGITDRLRNVVEDCVNVVGVDVNTASADLLRYVSGLNDTNVKEILAHRSGSAVSTGNESSTKKVSAKKTNTAAPGRLMSLADLRGVKGIGPKTFSNCAGFLRVYDGAEPLDATNIHPDDYALAKEMLKIYKKEQTTIEEAILPEAKKSKKKEKSDQNEKEHREVEMSASKEETTGNRKTTSFWEKFLSTAADGNAKIDQHALLRTKSVAELEQIWAWLQEARLVPTSASSLSSSSLKGPYMSAPKLLQRLPADFQAKIEVGSIVQGVIRNVTTFGAFVDLGGVEIHSAESSSSTGGSAGASKSKGKASCDGLLHSSKYRDFLTKRTGGARAPGNTAMSMATEIYVGREVKVKIISIDDAGAAGGKSDGHDKRRISLDLLELL